LQVTDEDLDDEHSYSIIDSTMEVSDSSLDYLKEKSPFIIREDTLVLNFDVQDSSLKGLFKFGVEVSDKGLLPYSVHMQFIRRVYDCILFQREEVASIVIFQIILN
jgi:hypothetical protein